MKRWLLLTFIFGLIGLPGTLFLVNTLEVSNQVHVTALVESPNEEVASVTPISEGGGGLNGQGAASSNDSNEEDDEEKDEEEAFFEAQTAVYFGGYAFPNALVTFTLDGEDVLTVSADSEGYFEASFEEVGMGEHIFGFQAESYDDQESRSISYAYTVENEAPLYISSILLPPIFDTIDNGEDLGGVAIPGSEIKVFGVSQSTQALVELDTIQVMADGTYSANVDLEGGEYSQYYVACSFRDQNCGYSGIIPVQIVGDTYEIPSNVFADFTNDIQVNFVDFSFMREAYLNNKSILFYDLDEDGTLTLKDFSLLDYQWTQ